MAENLEVVVVGAGVVGLAVARCLALDGRAPLVLEAEDRVGLHSSGRNSEVVHAGIYYGRGSLKARLCVKGKALLYEYCRQHGIAHAVTGKLILAASQDEIDTLNRLFLRGTRNGVPRLEIVSASDVSRREPGIDCVAALYSPTTGIVDSQALLLQLQADIEAAGGHIVFRSRVSNIRPASRGFELRVDDQTVACRVLINAGGLGAAALDANLSRTFPRKTPRPEVALVKGHYFDYTDKIAFRHLIYPMPTAQGLGIHATIDLNGAIRFGPDASEVSSLDYEFEPERRHEFATAIRRYFPALDKNKLSPSYTGIRPRVSGASGSMPDFFIEIEGDRNAGALVTLLGIDSPGLTASLAIAEHIRRFL